MNEGNGNISTWEELVKKFFKKFYPLSCASNYDKMCNDDEEGRDPLKFIPWRNSKFKDHKKVDETTKRALLYTWIEIGKEEGLLNDEVSSDEEWEEHEYRNPPFALVLEEPSEEVDNVGGVFINLEISKCWSLEISRRLFNTLFAQELNLEDHHEQTIREFSVLILFPILFNCFIYTMRTLYNLSGGMEN
ncbi:hypothetical protein Tco_1112033 [Tanacetum coccineum]|uniref:Uncharacterized protein n=1 Tax=Tanacetum coccineum TaxID=301880 RepID=A0ABQ5INB2_9ASTR